MGYNTRYTLKIIEEDERSEYLERLGVTNSEPIDHIEHISERYETWFEDAIKWYDHDKNMREYSEEYPDVLFELSGEGEESGDIWRAYYKNGLCHRVQARIVFDEFNEEHLR